MTIKSLLKKLSSIEGVDASILESIQTEADKLSAKATELSQQNGSNTARATALESTVADIGKALGLEAAEPAELLSTVTGLVQAKQELTTEKETLTARATAAEGKAQGLERSAKMQQFATAGSMEPVVFAKLLGDRYEDLTVGEDGGLLLAGKPIKEAVDEDDNLKPFAPSLFKTEAPEPEPKKGSLPTGSPRGSEETPTDPLSAYLTKRSPLVTAA